MLDPSCIQTLSSSCDELATRDLSAAAAVGAAEFPVCSACHGGVDEGLRCRARKSGRINSRQFGALADAFVTFAVARLTYDLEMGVRIDIKPRLGAYVGVAAREGESLRWHWLAAR